MNATPRKLFKLAAVVLVFCLLALGATYLYVNSTLHTPYKGHTAKEQFVEIPRGFTVPQIARELESQGILKSARVFAWYVRLRGGSYSLKAGEYHFDRPVSPIEVAEKLHRGDIYYYKVTIPEGLDRMQIISEFVRHGFGTVEEFDQLSRDPQSIVDLDPQAHNLEGYLFPETYLLTRHMTPAGILTKMVANFRRIWTPEFQRRAEELGFTVRDVITLASLIEKETAIPEERKLVSSVFQNRLLKNMNLACDPTVIYAVKQVKEYDGVINQSDLALDSPYNTYLYPGLPPGPIASPGLASINAALYPTPSDYLFFVSRNDGSHIFSTTYQDHQRAVMAYQRPNGGGRK